MKKVIALVLSILCLFISFVFTGCEQANVLVESVLNIDENFSGVREVNIYFPLTVDIDSMQDTIISKAPVSDNVKFEYVGVEESGYHFKLTISFSSREEYISSVNSIVGRDVDVYLSRPNSVLTIGTRMKEDFDTSDLIYWIPRVTKNNQDCASLNYIYKGCTVSIDGDIFSTGSTINIVERTGLEINSITIDTTNKKDDTFDRTITFSIPNKTYDKIGSKLSSYFVTNTMPQASFYGWTDKGETQEYTVIYKDINMSELIDFTSRLLDTQDVSIVYGDLNNTSTPLSEGLTFEEDFNTFSFIGPNSNPVNIIYNYALPDESIHGEGTTKLNGEWKQNGEWESGVYSASVSDDIFAIRIPDGMQYEVKRIDFGLESTGDNNFIRTTEFKFAKDSREALDYANKYFSKKSADVVTNEDDEYYICKVTCEGTTGEITDELVKLFGSGNYLSYTKSDRILSLSTKTELVDNINIGYMLNETNAKADMLYTVSSSGNENIYSLECVGSNITYDHQNGNKLNVPIIGGDAKVEYHGDITNNTKLVIYIVFTILLLIGTAFAVIIVNRKDKKATVSVDNNEDNSNLNNNDAEFENAPYQTTVFKISDLMNLKDKTEEITKEEFEENIEVISQALSTNQEEENIEHEEQEVPEVLLKGFDVEELDEEEKETEDSAK